MKVTSLLLINYGTEEEINNFLISPYYKSDETNPDNIINDFQEYIQDGMDWELYKQVIKDGYIN